MHYFGYTGYSPMYYTNSFWPEGLISMVITVLFWVAIVSLFVYIFKRVGGHGHHGGCCGMHGGHGHADMAESEESGSYMDIIKERYAKGEIDKKQFEELKKDLAE